MQIQSLYVDRFRKLSDSRFHFTEGIQAIVGQNAIGKTTLLEALYFLIAGKSFRTHRMAELFQNGSEAFFLSVCFLKHGVEQELKVYVNGQERKVLYNATSFPTLSSLLGMILGSVMTPDDANLIKGAPQTRREFLDLQIAETDPLYNWHLNRYTRAMRHRNALLKAKQTLTCESFEHEMAASAAYITCQRRKTIETLTPLFQQKYRTLGEERESVGLSYKSSLLEDPRQILTQYVKNRARDMQFGATLQGPHKDEIEIEIEGKEAKSFASEGQKQTLIAALKLAEWQRLLDISQETPLFMIDDMGLGMDGARKKRFFRKSRKWGRSLLPQLNPLLSTILI